MRKNCKLKIFFVKIFYKINTCHCHNYLFFLFYKLNLKNFYYFNKMSKSVGQKPSLWNNEMVNSALKSMSPSDLEHYKKLGESLYKDLNFETSNIESKENIPPYLSDALAYIVESIKSGLHPSMLDEDEKKVLEEIYGKEWYLKFDYTKEDLTDIVTVRTN